MQLKDKQITNPQPTERSEIAPIESAPNPSNFPWKWLLGILIAIPVSAIGLLVGGLFLMSWLIGPIDPCGGLGDPETPAQQPPRPRNAP